jgi:hypothetical protein
MAGLMSCHFNFGNILMSLLRCTEKRCLTFVISKCKQKITYLFLSVALEACRRFQSMEEQRERERERMYICVCVCGGGCGCVYVC